MSNRVKFMWVLSFICFVSLSTEAFSQRRSNRSRGYYTSSSQRTVQGQSTHVYLNADQVELFTDKVKLELNLPNDEKYVNQDYLMAKVEGVRLNNSTEKFSSHYQIEVPEIGKGYFEVDDLKAESVYQLNIVVVEAEASSNFESTVINDAVENVEIVESEDTNMNDGNIVSESEMIFLEVSDKNENQERADQEEQVVARILPQINVVTTGENNSSKQRSLVAIQALKEWKDWRRGHRSKQYVQGAWCFRFCKWVIKEILNKNISSGIRGNANDIRTKNIQGDMGYTPPPRFNEYGHYFLLIAYDQATGQVWTVEGNYSNAVVMNKRNASSFQYMPVLKHLTLEN